eukprot:3143377-Pleurochrysis_carterae.AAC.1
MVINYKGELGMGADNHMVPGLRTFPTLETSNPHTTVRPTLLWSTCSWVGLFTAKVSFVNAVPANCTWTEVCSSRSNIRIVTHHSPPPCFLQPRHNQALRPDPLGHVSCAVVDGAAYSVMWAAAEGSPPGQTPCTP